MTKEKLLKLLKAHEWKDFDFKEARREVPKSVHEPRPFTGIDQHAMMREDTPPGYRVFREAAINLLIHQDYGDHSRKAFEFRLPLVESKKDEKLYQKTKADKTTGQVTGQVKLLLKAMSDKPVSVSELMKKLELKHRETFLENYLHPAIEMGLVVMTNPESPRSPKQKYVITEKGMSIKKNGDHSA